ncbi:MAG: Wzt carbohydrate-binding domain-containing protein, partial [Oscillospiraceae bacterium]
VNTVTIKEFVTIKIVYDVYDDSIENPVLGIAVFGIDDAYICGLNTLLDKKNIPWKYGRNEFYMDYYEGVSMLGGKYYFKAGIFDQTACVPFDFNQKINEFTVSDDYLAEGIFIIPHKWRGKDE